MRPRVSAIAEFVREAFWVLALGVIGCYAFFVALGAFAPGDSGREGKGRRQDVKE